MSNLLTVKFNRSRRQIKLLPQSFESLLTFRLLTITQTVNTNVPNDQLPYCCGKQEQRKRALALLLYMTLLSEFHFFLYIILFIWNHLESSYKKFSFTSGHGIRLDYQPLFKIWAHAPPAEIEPFIVHDFLKSLFCCKRISRLQKWDFTYPIHIQCTSWVLRLRTVVHRLADRRMLRERSLHKTCRPERRKKNTLSFRNYTLCPNDDDLITGIAKKRLLLTCLVRQNAVIIPMYSVE